MKSIPTTKEQIKIDDANRVEKERLKEEGRQRYLRSLERKRDEGVIDTTKEMTAENLKEMADQVLMAKALEVRLIVLNQKVFAKVAQKKCNVCNTHAYLANTRIQELIEKIGIIDREVLGRDKLVKTSSERIKELTEKIEKDKSDVERVLQAKEKQINQKLDEIANLKLQFQEAKIENERINLQLNSYNSASFVLQHIVPKPIGKNKAGEDVYSDGTGVGYHQVPPPVLNNFTKKQSGLANESETSEKTDAENFPEIIDVTFTSQSDEDSIQSEVVKNVVENVLKSDSDSTEEDECFLNNYIPKLKSQDNLSDEPTLVLYKMCGSDKLYLDTEFPIENVNVDKLKKVSKLVEIYVSDIEGLKSSKDF
ncbi:hypothetical protein Hanom_Chr05g00423351 [Helianthus anomalus]